MQNNEFRKFATKHLGMNGHTLDKFVAAQGNYYVSPTILEERQLNVTQMDVFSRLMMDRIIFLGTPIDDYVANVIQAQLLFLDTSDPGKDISIYINSPGGVVQAGLAYTIRCSMFRRKLGLSAQVWLPLWRQCCSWQARKADGLPYPTRE